MLWIKDSNGITDNAYCELSALCSNMPRLWTLKTRIEEINKLWNLKDLPNGVIGVQHCIKDILYEHAKLLDSIDNNVLKVKISGDGTQVGQRGNFVLITITILNEGPIAKTSKGNHVLAIIKGKEDYATLKNGLEDICNELKHPY